MSHDSTNSSRPSRRVVAKGAAWAVPAVAAVGVPAPAYAASGPTPELTFLGACKFPGRSCSNAPFGYGFFFTATNLDQSQSVHICDATLTNVSPPFSNDAPRWVNPGGSGCLTLPAGATGQLILYFSSTNSGNLDFTANLNITWAHTCPCANDPDNHAPIVIPISVGGTPPGGLCQCSAPWIPAG
jgi:hypothetical protein